MRNTIGLKLKKLRDDRNLTIREVSRLTGLGTNTISRWENDKVSPKIQHLKAITEFYGVGVSYFSETENSLEQLNRRVGALEARVEKIEERRVK
jgi:transcriptional regulator with XRE-family HTH domain